MYKLEFVHYQLCVPDTRAGPHPRGASLSPSPVLIYHLCAAAGFSFRFKTPMDFCTNKVNLCLARAVTIPVPAKCSQSSRTSWKFKRVSWGFAQRCPVCVCWSPSEALQKSAGGRGEPGDLQREMKRPLCERADQRPWTCSLAPQCSLGKENRVTLLAWFLHLYPEVWLSGWLRFLPVLKWNNSISTPAERQRDWDKQMVHSMSAVFRGPDVEAPSCCPHRYTSTSTSQTLGSAFTPHTSESAWI